MCSGDDRRAQALQLVTTRVLDAIHIGVPSTPLRSPQSRSRSRISILNAMVKRQPHWCVATAAIGRPAG